MSQTISMTILESEPIQAYQSYPSLFQLGNEIPQFDISYRWWEDDAKTILWAFKISEISQVARYRLFSDEALPRASLLSRNPDTIDMFLADLSDPSEYQFLESLSHLQRVEEILRRMDIPKFQPVPWSWFPPAPDLLNPHDPCEIASAIETESHFHFSKIAFEEIVRASLGYGYKAVSVDWFLLQHNALFVHLLDHLKAHPEEINLYVEVEKHLRSKSPFARRALVECIHNIRPEATERMPISTDLGFEFISGPIQALLRTLQTPSLTVMLKIFSVLAIRYRQQYLHASSRCMDWNSPFNTTSLLLEDYIHSGVPADLAHILTSTDEMDFEGVSSQAIISNEPEVRRLIKNWHTLSISVWECCSASPEMTKFLRETTPILYSKRNYYSLTAILDGLRRYAATTAKSHELNMNGSTVPSMVVLEPLQPSQLQFLMNSDDNFVAYREHYYQYPGLPFLIPHIRDPNPCAIQSVLDYLKTNL
ncbi:hypothetical protein N7495_009653 [Penicillium taxi]|uniref:uncharacterized protein n=1 Tax=Penicillium taxi TaxID=168475 RepID=UPI00254550CA|nr:uncharacterized protein N7495_009653 [Penicillium taxi]KAJ5885143.1 hypothetical protein N7495_009653 [Penicillium taxi]